MGGLIDLGYRARTHHDGGVYRHHHQLIVNGEDHRDNYVFREIRVALSDSSSRNIPMLIVLSCDTSNAVAGLGGKTDLIRLRFLCFRLRV